MQCKVDALGGGLFIEAEPQFRASPRMHDRQHHEVDIIAPTPNPRSVRRGALMLGEPSLLRTLRPLSINSAYRPSP